MREAVREIVVDIEPFDELEAEHRADVLEWIDSGAEIFRREKPATPPKHLVSYCVLVDEALGRILLVDHRLAERWLPTGGHVDSGEYPATTARREIHEELGIRPEFLTAIGDRPLMVTVTDTGGRSQTHTDVSLWFAFDARTAGPLVPDQREFADIRWWDIGEIRHSADTRFDPHLPRFAAKLAAQPR